VLAFLYFQVGRVFIPTVIVHVASIYDARNRKKLVTGRVICIPLSFTTLLLANVRHFTSLSNGFGSIKQFLGDQVVTKLLVLHYMLTDVRVCYFLLFVCVVVIRSVRWESRSLQREEESLVAIASAV
jgi:uncharacterized membrane protein